MIADAGGWQHDTLTEDSDLSYRAQLKGWRFVYMPGLDCLLELLHRCRCTDSRCSNLRWAKGLTQVAKKLLPAILKIGHHPAAESSRHFSAPDTEYLVPDDDRRLGVNAARHDRAVLHGSLADAVSWISLADRGFVLVDFRLFYVSRSASDKFKELEAIDSTKAADADGGGRRPDYR